MFLYSVYLIAIFIPFFVSITLLLLTFFFDRFFDKALLIGGYFRPTFTSSVQLNLLFLYFILFWALFDVFLFFVLCLYNDYALISIFDGFCMNFKWIACHFFLLEWGFSFDFLSILMLCIVSTISCLVITFSLEYMSHDPQQIRFLSLLSLFTWTMFLLISADNVIQLFFGWEAVGVCSYLLINFWHTRIFANLSAMKAIIMNRVGDFGLLCAILLIYFTFKSFKFSIIFALCSLHLVDSFSLFVISIFLLIGAFGKSAQLLLHTWLPDAMEGPTPVSALIHAATMVTAGIFLVIRFSCFFENVYFSGLLLGLFSSLTSVFAATCGLFQNDIKKVIAYSTCSQLGFMFFCCSCSAYNIAFFHLATHAFFKALLFLCAGSIIHSLGGEQDIRRMGGLYFLLPFTYQCFLIGSLTLMGFPFFSGFFSKDLILEIGFFSDWIYHSYFLFLILLALCGTLCYSLRLLYLVFLQRPVGQYTTYLKLHECSYFIFISLFILSFGSVFFGFLFVDVFAGLGRSFVGTFEFSPFFFCQYFIEFLNFKLKLFSLILLIFITIIFFIGFFVESFKPFSLFFSFTTFSILHTILFVFSKKWFFDSIFIQYIGNFFNYLSFHILFIILDRGLIEFLGPFGVILLLSKGSRTGLHFQTGRFLDYLSSFFICILLFFFLFI